MTDRIVQTEDDRHMLVKLVEEHAMPFTVTLTKGKRRSVAQNRLQRQWMNEISEQLDDRTPEEWRGYCKLTIGVAILKEENEAFAHAYDKIVRPLSYEDKLAGFMLPLDWAVTRHMTTKQKTKYLDGVARHFGEKGVILTQPEDAT